MKQRKKQSEARAGRQGGKAKAEASKQPQHGTQPGETAAGKGRRKREEKTKGARQPGGTEKRDKRDKKKEEQSKNKGNPLGGRPHRHQANPTTRPTTKPPDTRPPKGGTRGKGLMRLDAQASGPTSLEVCAGHVRTATKQLRAVKTCVRKGHLLLPKINQS